MGARSKYTNTAETQEEIYHMLECLSAGGNLELIQKISPFRNKWFQGKLSDGKFLEILKNTVGK